MRCLALALPEHEKHRCNQREGKGNRNHRDGVRRPNKTEELELVLGLLPPAIDATFDQTKDQGREHNHRDDCTDPVDATLALLGLGFSKEVHKACDDDDTKWQVDQKGPAPAEVGSQPATKNRSNRNHSTDGGTPDCKGNTALFTLEVCVHQRQGGWQNHRATNALNHTGQNHGLRAIGVTGPDRSRNKDHDAYQ